MKSIFTSAFALAAIALIIVGCTPKGPTEEGPPLLGGEGQLSASQELKKFSSVEELKEYLDARQGSRSGYDGYGGTMMRATVAMESADMAAGAPAPSSAGKSASDYSQTNVQVQGVDEADYIKNDGKHIYVLSQEKLVIVEAYPAEDAEIVSKTEIEGYPRELFLSGDRLVVFTEVNDERMAIDSYEFIPSPRWVTQTHALVFDITDRSEPELIHDYAIGGSYFASRMIGGEVYFLVREGVGYNDEYPIVPRIMEEADGGSATLIKPDIYYFDNPEESYTFTTIASLGIESGDVEAKTFLLGWANTLYVSEENIYVAYQKNEPYWYGREASQRRFYDVIVPNLPASERAEIEAIEEDSSLKEYERWERISDVLEEMYNRMDEDDKRDLVAELRDKAQEYEAEKAAERQRTVIHRLGIDGGEIDYGSRGEVPGQLLNQFSMDENEGELRVATTSYIYTRYDSTVHNNVYVLDSDMDITGRLEGLAEDERIYSTRFVGDRLYMVTFERIDPLFVIDLSGSDPEVLGELKIPGFSDYLHPYDEDHIIGIGKETKENEWGGVSVKGVKVALFDVSDVENPKQVDMVEIGTAGSDSEALQDHKAFLFDREKNLLVLPIREVRESWDYSGTRCAPDSTRCWPYRQDVWQGAYVFKVTDDGFEKMGKISHREGEEEFGWYWGSPWAVKRSLFMDDVLYTLSPRMIKMNDLSDDLEEIGEVELPYRAEQYGPYYGGREVPVMME